MAKYFPEDGIFHNEEGEDLLVRREHGYSGMSDSLYDRNEGGRGVEQEKSIGVVTRLERFDQELGRKYLRKDGWQDFLGGENEDMKYDEEYVVSPDRGRYYDNLSNYQFSVMKHLEETSPNLPYEDRKSVRLSVMSNRNEPGKNSFLNPNRKRVGNNTREEYERQMQLSKRGERPFGLSVRKEQMSIMSEPRGRPSGMKKISGFNINPVATEDTSKRLNVPPININIGGLDDISSKGSQAESKIEKKNEENKQDKADQISKDTKNNTGTELLPAKPVQKVQFKEPERPQEINKSEEKVADQSKEESSKETGEKLKTTDRKTEEENNENNDKI